ncbi:hypothetical protein HanRHA438_Chr11g0488471 [Helianthus annuus]|uniref:Uncharacterized protein n=1 Tax=Helianthus annuus TaxID=4232 RepID=A0A251T8M1_HELAN|nr:hypothetical protein HanXRQr2_Chr11g0475071 [Helianthus annuus]KAJ0869371.1 hypothetical protein HanRHA438_Chr11g0488471 [Helianthus annuus]KAJ0873917.1 hypothetical protein HanPSC8_Chr11g0458091 [Helianthus annuus]
MALCFIFLLMLLLTHLSLHSSLPIQNLDDSELGKFSAVKLNKKLFLEYNNGKRLELHEVHSGPNPISNSFREEVPDMNLETAP